MLQEPTEAGEDTLDSARLKIIEGTARRLLLTARYNGQVLSLAPHALFARHGDLFLRALNLSKNWRSDEDRRLGDFKVAGLGAVQVTEQPFEVLASADPLLSRPEDQLLFAAT